MLHPVAFAESPRDEGRVVHQLEVGPPLEQPLRQQVVPAVVGRRHETEIEGLESGEDGQPDPEDLGKRRPQGRQARTHQIKKESDGRGSRDQRQRRKAEEQARRRREVTALGERPAVPLIPLVAQAPVHFDVDELGAR